MPPPIEGFDPFKGVKGIEQAGEDISSILAEANKAEAQLRERRMAQKGADYLHQVISHQTIGKGTPENPENPNVGFAPFLDPIVQQAALAISPIAPDYVALLKGISAQNERILEPKITAKGIVQYDPRSKAFKTTQFTNVVTHEIVSPHRDGTQHKFLIGSDKDTGTELWRHDLGVNYERPLPGESTNVREVAKSVRNLREAQKIITDFEANPKMTEQYKNIISNPEFKSAIGSGDVDLAQGIVAKLLGDTTPQKVQVKAIFDYMKAVNQEEGEKAFLEQMGEDTKKYERKKPEVKKKGTGF